MTGVQTCALPISISAKSEVTRGECANGLAILLREVCELVEIHTFSDSDVLIPSRRGFALRDAIDKAQPHSGTYLGRSMESVRAKCQNADRTIVLTDEQSADAVGGPIGLGYMINVASEANGVGHGEWLRITGWSESIVNFIVEHEKETHRP